MAGFHRESTSDLRVFGRECIVKMFLEIDLGLAATSDLYHTLYSMNHNLTST